MESTHNLLTGGCPLAPEPSLDVLLSKPSSFADGFLVGRVRILPFDAFIGGFYILYVVHYIKKFIDSFSDDNSTVSQAVHRVQTLRDRVIERVIYTVQAVSSTMLFFDWGLDKGWFVLKCVARTSIKAVANSMSVIFWSYKCVENIQNLVALPSLIEEASNAKLYEKVELEPEIYKEWISLFANFAFVLASGMQVLALATGVAVAAVNIEFLVTASLGFMVAGWIAELFFNSSEKVTAARLMFSEQNSSFTHLK